METLKRGDTVRYVGEIFPDLANETYEVVQVYPGTFSGIPYPDGTVEIIGLESWKLFKKHRFDFEKIES